MDYPKYQWSFFINGDRNSQIVVRTDNSKEMENAIVKILPIVKKIGVSTKEIEKTQNVQQAQQRAVEIAPQEGGLTATCEVHKDAQGLPVKLTRKISKTGNEYWAHWRKLPNGEFDICFGKGWKSEEKK